MRVFADANVLFSAAAPQSATRLLLGLLFHHATVVINDHVWEEARRNVAIKRPNLVGNLENLKSEFHFCARMVSIPDCPLPDKDQPVLGGAVADKCSHLWTGDKRHFGSLYGKTIQGTLIVSATLLADELMCKGWIPKG